MKREDMEEMAKEMVWQNLGKVERRTYVCGHCKKSVGSVLGYKAGYPLGTIYICPVCHKPSYFPSKYPEVQIPGVPFGSDIDHLPAGVAELYDEARNCIAVASYTSAVLACRKLLMHIAVEKGAKPGEQFIAYVDYLEANHFIPPDGRAWVDQIRKKGNEANHQIVLMQMQEATDLVSFIEMLLKFVYEFPGRLATQRAPKRVSKKK